ncbi:MAG: hypothetical protein JKY20_05735 [Alphaproteobacteria bacterium]|nr:hypothetical protein [Alphaproteobacteria bacterium]
MRRFGHAVRSRAILVPAIALLSFATACGSTSDVKRAAPKKVTPLTETSVVAIPLRAAPKPTASIAWKNPPARIATAPRIPMAPPKPGRLIGMNGAAVAELLGPARFVRRDGPAEVWQYRNEHCVLDVFLYGRDRLNVTYFDLRKRRTGAMEPTACYAELTNRAKADS